MAPFWFLTGSLGTLALLIALLPALRRLAVLESVSRTASIVLSTIAIVLAVSLGTYMFRVLPGLPGASAGTHGMTAAPHGTPAPAAMAVAAAGSSAGGSMESAVASLEGKLARGGGSADEWELLAKSYEFLGRSDDARLARAHQLPPRLLAGAQPSLPTTPTAQAPLLTAESQRLLQQAALDRIQRHYDKAVSVYRRLAAQNQLSADGWADYADAAASISGRLSGEPESYVDRALAIDPTQPKALWLKASAAEEQGHWADAVQGWQRLSARVEPGSDDARIVAESLKHAQAMIAAGSAGAQAASSGTAITGEVTLSEQLRSRAAAATALFIVAKSVASPAMPVAVLRQAPGPWPVRFTLGDAQAMVPGRALSNAGPVRIEARLSRSGQALPASGDLRGTSGIVDPRAGKSVGILIDQVVP